MAYLGQKTNADLVRSRAWNSEDECILHANAMIMRPGTLNRLSYWPIQSKAERQRKLAGLSFIRALDSMAHSTGTDHVILSAGSVG